MSDGEVPIVCDLASLNGDQRRRERDLLERFRKTSVKESETAEGVWFSVPAQPEALASLGELLALERLCCPFLSFHLEVTRNETCRLLISGPPGAKALVLAEFVG